jgi:disulfide bond formation protein DsbB
MLVAAAGSAALMIAALGFQHLGDMPPCTLCYWQRYGHVGAIAAGGIAAALPIAAVAVLGALSVASSAAIGAYHTGVERGWWEGPATCTAGPIGDLTTDELMAQIMAAPLVRCDEVPWEMLGLSMASWNMLAALGLAALWLLALRMPR